MVFKARAHLEKLLGVAKAPTLAVTPSPPFPWNGKTKWNPALETSLDIDGVAIDAKYTMVRDSVSVDHLDFEVSTTHESTERVGAARQSAHRGGGTARHQPGRVLARELVATQG